MNMEMEQLSHSMHESPQQMRKKVVDILHDTTQQKFFVIVDEHESRLFYERRQGALDLKRTIIADVDPAKKLADNLVVSAFEYARKQNLKVIPSCRYVEQYLDEHPHWEYLSTASVEMPDSDRLWPLVWLVLAMMMIFVSLASTVQS